MGDVSARASTSRRSTRLDWVDAGKGISILLVVLYHAAGWMAAAGWESPVLNQTNEILLQLRMPVFFFLAGLFAIKWIEGPWSALLSKKVALFAWVYLLWSVLALPANWLSMSVLTDKVQDDFVVRQILVFATIPFRASGSLWFIWALLFFFILAKLSIRLPKWFQLGLAGLSSFGVRLIPDNVNADLVEATGLGYRGVVLFYVFFLLGAFFSEAWKAKIQLLNKPWAVLVVGLWIAMWTSFQLLGLHDLPGMSLGMAFGGLAAGIALAVILQGISLLRWIGSHTLPIYLAHSPILILLTVVMQGLPLSGQVVLVAVALALTGATTAVTLGLYQLRRFGFRYLYETPLTVSQWFRRVGSSKALSRVG